MKNTAFSAVLTLSINLLLISPASDAAIIYSNDFETNTNGFDTTDRGTFSDGTSNSTWLGGYRDFSNATVTLTLTGLSAGAEYDLAFDLRLAGSWDGSGSFGPDYFRLRSSSAGFLINATFVNDFPRDPVTGLGTSGKTQTYSDSTPLGDGGLFVGRTGADIALGFPIYYFGRGAGNPLLTFTANSSVETLQFSSSDRQLFAPDEFFSIDNVVVNGPLPNLTPVPLPSALFLFITGLVGLRFKLG